jgi:hypothetical protein
MNQTRISDKNVGNEGKEKACVNTEELIEAVAGMTCDGSCTCFHVLLFCVNIYTL